MTSTSSKASVIIPAHNEQQGITRCLKALMQPDIKLDVIVVANACTDATAELARCHGATVVETAVPGKANALNIGDASSTVFPRIYLDADTLLSASDAAVLVDRLQSDPSLLAISPALDWSAEPLGWFCRRYYAHWRTTEYVSRDLLGSGCYVLSEQGRATFLDFPDLISDDGFVHRVIPSAWRTVDDTARLTIFPPRTLRRLLSTKIRAKVGDIQVERYLSSYRDSRHGGAIGNTSDTPSRTCADHRRRKARLGFHSIRWTPHRAVDLIIYVSIRALVVFAARRRVRQGNYSWSRDDTARYGSG